MDPPGCRIPLPNFYFPQSDSEEEKERLEAANSMCLASIETPMQDHNMPPVASCAAAKGFESPDTTVYQEDSEDEEEERSQLCLPSGAMRGESSKPVDTIPMQQEVPHKKNADLGQFDDAEEMETELLVAGGSATAGRSRHSGQDWRYGLFLEHDYDAPDATLSRDLEVLVPGQESTGIEPAYDARDTLLSHTLEATADAEEPASDNNNNSPEIIEVMDSSSSDDDDDEVEVMEPLQPPGSFAEGTFHEADLRRESFAPESSKMKDGVFVLPFEEKKRTWEENYALLLEFHEEHGHANVPCHYSKDPRLARWLGAQRRRRHFLKPDWIAKLDALKITWGAGSKKQWYSQQWEAMFQCLQEYHEANGHCCVPTTYKPNQKLANWVGTQRQYYRTGKLTSDQTKQLQSLGFVLTKNTKKEQVDQQWEALFQCLQAFREKEGHCCVPKIYKPNPKLGNWVNNQRQNYRVGKLTKDQNTKLESIGLVKITLDARSKKQRKDQEWEAMFQCLQEYQEETGHCWAPRAYYPKLSIWVCTQRQRYKSGKLTSDQIKMLESIGLDWRPGRGRKSVVLTENWTAMFHCLETFKEKEGHCCVPTRYEPNPKLGLWVKNQRQKYKSGKLTPNQIEKLESIGFVLSQNWEDMFQCLETFREKEGHCCVPTRYKPNPKLGLWVKNQRWNYKSGKLTKTPNRIVKLESIGFVWKAN